VARHSAASSIRPALKRAAGGAQEALAKRAGISRAYLSRLEMGLHDPPLSMLEKLAKALKVKVTMLLE
jgi:transcriptional regulator with XRE-family HTH domain